MNIYERNRIYDHLLAPGQYRAEVTPKKSIFLHHTAGGHRPDWTIDGWNKDALGRIGTAFVIGGMSVNNYDGAFDGVIMKAFNPENWAYHLGVKGKPQLDAGSIGIEICNYGGLTLTPSGTLLNYVNKPVPDGLAYCIPDGWRGSRYFHKYTDFQLEAARGLILKLSEKFGIPVKGGWDIDSFQVNERALAGVAGLWTHCNVRGDKTDLHPQPELIQMLNSL